MTAIPNPVGITKDGWYAKHTGEHQLWGPVKNLRTAVQTWPEAIYQRVEEGMVVTSVDMRPTSQPIAPRHDEALLRKCLSAMPLGKYHTKDTEPVTLFCDGEPVMYLGVAGPDLSVKVAEGCVAALVHLLNTREQTRIGCTCGHPEWPKPCPIHQRTEDPR